MSGRTITMQRLMPWRGDSVPDVLINPVSETYNSPYPSSLEWRSFPSHPQGNDAKTCEAWFTHSWLAFVGHGALQDRNTCRRVTMASLYIDTRSARCFHRAPSLPYFPCFPSVTRFGAFPAPCGSACLCFALCAPYGFRLSENLCATNAKRFSEPSEKDAP